MARSKADDSLFGESLTGESLAPKKAGNLAEKFMIPPFTVLSAREGWWQDRKRAWLALGIQSELGRGAAPTSTPVAGGQGNRMADAIANRALNRAAPGGSAMPAMNYKNRERGTGAGKAVSGTGAGRPTDKTASNPHTEGGKLLIDRYREKAKTAPLAPESPPTVAPAPAGLAKGVAARIAAMQQQKPPVANPPDPANDDAFADMPLPDLPLAAPTKAVAPAPTPKASAAAPAAPSVVEEADPFAEMGDLPLASFRAGASSAIQITATMPESNWVAPTSLPNLAGVKRIAIDTENFDPDLFEKGPGVRRGSYIAGVTIAIDGGQRLYYPLRHEGGGNVDNDWFWNWARSELNNFDGEVVGAKLDYDLDFLAEQKVTFEKVKAFHDVQIIEPLLDEWRFEYNLDALSKDYLKEGKDEKLLYAAAQAMGFGVTERVVKSNIWRMPAKFIGPYAEADGDRPLRILPLQLKRLADENLERVYEVERKLLPILVNSRRRGVRVNMAKADEVHNKLCQQRDEILAAFKRFAGPQAEFMAPDSFVHAFKEKGMEIPLTEKTKKPSIAKPFFGRYKFDPDVELLARGRKINTLINTFFNGHIFGHVINDRIHCTWNQLKGDDGGTIARFSSSDPNLQNLPKPDKKEGALVRQLFVPDDDCDWQRDDYSQIEYRLLVNYAVGPGAEAAREKYRSDPKTDFHKFVAALAKIDPEDEIKRSRVKALNFAKGYGAQAPKLAMMLGVPLAEAKAFIAEYDAAMPFAQKTFDKAQEWGGKRGFIETVLGRRQRFPLWEPLRNFGKFRKPGLPREQAERAYGKAIQRSNTYTALNRKLQGSAADIMKKAIVDAHEAGLFAPGLLGAFLVTVHDELGNSVPRTKQGDEAGKELSHIMETTLEFKVPIYVATKRGANWGECS